MNIINKIILILIVGMLSCKGKINNQPVASTTSEIEKVKLTNLNDQPIDLSQYQGKTLFINFWATWCKPCLLEMPSIQKAQGILKDQNIVFLFASDESPEQIENFKAAHDYMFNYVRVENMEELNITGLPTTFIFNPEGKLAYSEIGYQQWDDPNNISMILKIAESK